MNRILEWGNVEQVDFSIFVLFSPLNFEAWFPGTQAEILACILISQFYFHANLSWLDSEMLAGRGLLRCSNGR